MTEVFIQGFLGRDCLLRETKDGVKFATFPVCSNEFISGKEKTQWFDCMWYEYNPKLAEYLKKGYGVNVIGTLDVYTEEGEDKKVYVRRRVIVHHVTFALSPKSKDDRGQDKAAKPQVQHEEVVDVAPVDVASGVNTAKFDQPADIDSELPF